MCLGEGSFPFIMGIICGYPIGAKITADFKLHGICTQEECERLISFTNNSSPLFIIGTVGIGLFKDSKTGILLFLTHILSCITVGILFRWWKKEKSKNKKGIHSSIYSCSSSNSNINLNSKVLKLSNLGEVLSSSIMSSIRTILLIGGFIVLFSVVLSVLNSSNIILVLSKLISPFLHIFNISAKYCEGLIYGIIELTNGVYKIALIQTKKLSINIILCAFLLGFGGISVAMQILSIVSKAKISIKPYLIGKLLQAIFASVYTYLFLKYFTVFNLDLI